MDRDTFPEPRSEAIDPSAETVINGAPYDGKKHSQVGAESPVDRPEAPASEVKRRLMAVAELYRAAQRDTVGG